MLKILCTALILVSCNTVINAMTPAAAQKSPLADRLTIRNRIIDAAISASHGVDLQESTKSDDELGDVLRAGSPEEFIKNLRNLVYEGTKDLFVDKGIDPQTIARTLHTYLTTNYAAPHIANASRPAAHVRRVALRATSSMEGPRMQVVCDNSSKHLACVKQNVMIVNEKMLESAQFNTPRKLYALARHEKAHAEVQDIKFRAAFDELLNGIKTDPTSALSPDSQNLRAIVSRTGEVFADLRSASENLEAAQNMLRLVRKLREKYKADRSHSHPSDEERVKLAELMVELHENIKPKPVANENHQMKPAKRSLLKELEQVSKKSRTKNKKSGGTQ